MGGRCPAGDEVVVVELDTAAAAAASGCGSSRGGRAAVRCEHVPRSQGGAATRLVPPCPGAPPGGCPHVREHEGLGVDVGGDALQLRGHLVLRRPEAPPFRGGLLPQPQGGLENAQLLGQRLDVQLEPLQWVAQLHAVGGGPRIAAAAAAAGDGGSREDVALPRGLAREPRLPRPFVAGACRGLEGGC